MNGRELFEVYALEASLSSDGHRPYWDFLKSSQRDLWDRVAKRLTSENPLAGVVVYEVDGSRYTFEAADGGPGGERDRANVEDYPLGPGRIKRLGQGVRALWWRSR